MDANKKMNKDQILVRRAFNGFGDGNEKAQNIEELFFQKAFYKDIFGEELDILSVHIPPKPVAGDWWRLHINAIPRKMFSKNFYWELIQMSWKDDGGNVFLSGKKKEEIELYSQTFTTTTRTSNFRPYAVWLPDRSSAPDEVIDCFRWTFEEALLDDLMLFKKTGIVNTCKEVVCYGTIDFRGDFPVVCRGVTSFHLAVYPLHLGTLAEAV